MRCPQGGAAAVEAGPEPGRERGAVHRDGQLGRGRGGDRRAVGRDDGADAVLAGAVGAPARDVRAVGGDRGRGDSGPGLRGIVEALDRDGAAGLVGRDGAAEPGEPPQHRAGAGGDGHLRALGRDHALGRRRGRGLGPACGGRVAGGGSRRRERGSGGAQQQSSTLGARHDAFSRAYEVS
jgi:hypothetical protein